VVSGLTLILTSHRVVRATVLFLSSIPLVYYVGSSVFLCLAFGSWTMLRLPILIAISANLIVEFQLYWLVVP
jgi:hypothetical protein